MRIKDILKLRQKKAISGTEKIPVSKDEYVTIDQINEEVKKDIDETLQDYIKKTRPSNSRRIQSRRLKSND